MVQEPWKIHLAALEEGCLSDESRTRRPLSTGRFSAINITHQQGLEPTTSCLTGRRTTNCAAVTKISELLFTKWSNKWCNKVEIWQKSEKTHILSFPLYMWVEQNKAEIWSGSLCTAANGSNGTATRRSLSCKMF